MQKLGLTSAERSAFHRALRSSHTRRIKVYITALDGSVISDVSQWLLDGQVLVDYEGEVTRTLTMSLLDPQHSLNFDSDSPADGALYADRMIRVDYIVKVDELADHVTTRVFHGPVTQLDRTGDIVNLEADGKERLAMGDMWRPLTIKKSTPKTDAIRTILRERAGETSFDIPDLSGAAYRLAATASYARTHVPWASSMALASSLNRQLFYPGDGIATLRVLPDSPVWTFKSGDGGDIVSEVAISNVMEDVKNTIVVVGAKPKGAKVRIQGVAVAEATHALSPYRLGRNGISRFLVETIEDDQIKTQAAADAKAKAVLNDRLRSVVEVTFDVLPIPHLDPGDLVALDYGDAGGPVIEFRLNQFSIPLGTEGSPTMSIGYHKQTTINRRRFRR